ncbi:unnamed protein product [Amoebophrya sp. A120]|nr:unnamed protein product [Amoebophrya sp. A120]|eukprot:GSA120T00016727001.1
MLYGFNTIKKLVGKGKRFAGMAIGKVFKVITIMRQVLRRVLKPAKAGAYVVGTGLQKTKDKFQVFWYSFLLPKLIATLDSAAADGAALTSPGNLARLGGYAAQQEGHPASAGRAQANGGDPARSQRNPGADAVPRGESQGPLQRAGGTRAGG